MSYIIRILVPEIPNKTGTYTKGFNNIEEVVEGCGGVLTGLPDDFVWRIDDLIMSNDLVLLNNTLPVSCYIAGMSKLLRLPVAGYVPKFDLLKSDTFGFLCDYVATGFPELRDMLRMFILHGRLIWEVDDAGESKRTVSGTVSDKEDT